MINKSPKEQSIARQRQVDAIFKVSTGSFAFMVLALLVGIIIALFIGAYPSIQAFGFSFLTGTEWDPVAEKFSALVAIYGTLMTSLIALVIAVPVSFGIAIFLTELCPRFLRRPFGIAIELLAGIPSIIYGMWGLFVFAPWFGDNIQPVLMDFFADVPLLNKVFEGMPIGIGIFTAGLILAIMIIPFITSIMRDVFEVTPPLLKESAYGLGATTWEVVRNIVLPYTKTGVIGGIMLGLGRALGETMAVTFVIGNAHSIDPGLFQPGNSITSVLANEFAESSSPLHLSSLMQLGLILFLITFAVLSLSKILLSRLANKEGAH